MYLICILSMIRCVVLQNGLQKHFYAFLLRKGSKLESGKLRSVGTILQKFTISDIFTNVFKSSGA